MLNAALQLWFTFFALASNSWSWLSSGHHLKPKPGFGLSAERNFTYLGPGTHAGRVEFQGTTWTALSDGSELEKGSHATIVCKENISLVVEPIK